MSTPRALLAGDLEPKLPDYAVIPDPRAIVPDPGKKGTVQILRASFVPNSTAPQSQYDDQMLVWVLSHIKEQPAAEDNLDEITIDVATALCTVKFADIWERAERLQHPSGLHGYRFRVNLHTEKEQ